MVTQNKIDTINPSLGRPLTWAEEYLLKFMKNNNSLLFIEFSPRLWPTWLIRRFVQPLLDAGYVRFYGNLDAKDAFKLTSSGAAYVAAL